MIDCCVLEGRREATKGVTKSSPTRKEGANYEWVDSEVEVEVEVEALAKEHFEEHSTNWKKKTKS